MQTTNAIFFIRLLAAAQPEHCKLVFGLLKYLFISTSLLAKQTRAATNDVKNLAFSSCTPESLRVLEMSFDC
jgi:hypothetical protein